MTIVVEDGTGLPNAVSYADANYADVYMQARGFTTWVALQTTEKEQALVRATDYMGLMFKWAGDRFTTTQALDWPRSGAELYGTDVGTDEIPILIKNACVELAYRAAQGPLILDPTQDDSGRLVGKVVERAGPIDEETTYIAKGQMSIPTLYKRYPFVDAMLRPLVENGGTGGGVYR
jgi:hypothetical protein